MSTPNVAIAESGHSSAKGGRNRQDEKAGRSTARVRGGGVKRGSGFLDSSGGGTAREDVDTETGQRGRRAERRRDRRSNDDPLNMTLIAYQVAQADVVQSRAEALRLYAIYDRLNTMTVDEQLHLYPDGQFAAALRDAAIRYNNAVASFQVAEAAAAQTLTNLTNGQELHGSALGELNALLGQ